MVLLYISRRLGWTCAIVLFIVVIGMFVAPQKTQPIVGAVVSIGDSVVKDSLSLIRDVLSGL
jgi:hypothetical protein